jgi:hypothetical protein
MLFEIIEEVPTYRLYLLQLWRAERDNHSVWRVWLERLINEGAPPDERNRAAAFQTPSTSEPAYWASNTESTSTAKPESKGESARSPRRNTPWVV